MFDTNSHGYPDSVKVTHKEYMFGIMQEFEKREPSPFRMKQLKTYLTELDRRRGTDFTKIYPEMWEMLKDL